MGARPRAGTVAAAAGAWERRRARGSGGNGSEWTAGARAVRHTLRWARQAVGGERGGRDGASM
jgi:hypothetical protein